MTGEDQTGGDGGQKRPGVGTPEEAEKEAARAHDRRLVSLMREVSEDLAGSGDADAAEWLRKAADRLENLLANPGEEPTPD